MNSDNLNQIVTNGSTVDNRLRELSEEVEDLQSSLYDKDQVILQLRGLLAKHEKTIASSDLRFREISEELSQALLLQQQQQQQLHDAKAQKADADRRSHESAKLLKQTQRDLGDTEAHYRDTFGKLQAAQQALAGANATEQAHQARALELEEENSALRVAQAKLLRQIESLKLESEELTAIYHQSQQQPHSHRRGARLSRQHAPASSDSADSSWDLPAQSIRDDLKGMEYSFYTPVRDRRSIDTPPSDARSGAHHAPPSSDAPVSVVTTSGTFLPRRSIRERRAVTSRDIGEGPPALFSADQPADPACPADPKGSADIIRVNSGDNPGESGKSAELNALREEVETLHQLLAAARQEADVARARLVQQAQGSRTHYGSIHDDTSQGRSMSVNQAAIVSPPEHSANCAHCGCILM